MKRFIEYSIMAAVLLTAAACRPEENVIEPKHSVEVTGELDVFPAEASTRSISLKAGGQWKAMVSEQWSQASPAEGSAGDYVIEVSTEANESTSSRIAKLTFRTKDTLVIKEFTQMGKDAIVIAKDQYEVPAAGGPLEFSIMSTRECEFFIADSCDWITPVPASKAMEEYKFGFTVDGNEEFYEREADILFRSKDGSLSQKVKVMQLGQDVIITEKSSYKISYKGGKIDMKIESNKDCVIDISQGCDWITCAPESKALAEKVYSFNVSANASESEREATVSFRSPDGRLKQAVKVYQSGVYNWTVSIVHSNTLMESPVNSHDATVWWGDGSQESSTAGTSLSHDYSGKGSYTMEVVAVKDFDRFHLKSLKGVSEIDLTRF